MGRHSRNDRKRKRRKRRKSRPRKKGGTTRRLRSVAKYLTLSEFAKRSTPPSDLIALVRGCEWRGSFRALALLAARLARSSPTQVSSELLAALAQATDHPNPPVAAAARLAAKHRGEVVLVHEQAIYFLQALVLLEGVEGDTFPLDGQLALWMLIANEYLHGWENPDSRPLTLTEATIAELALVARFNIDDDPLRTFARTALLFERRPTDAKLGQDPERWDALQRKAFGKPFSAAYRTMLAPLALASVRWGCVAEDGKREEPLIEMPAWIAPTLLDSREMQQFLDEITIDRATAIAELGRRVDDLPHVPKLFYRTPLVRMRDSLVAAASPTVIQERLRTGLWYRFADAAAKLGCDQDDWPSAFGYLFEAWCGDVARMAEKSAAFSDRLFIPTHPGAPDEIEDVVTFDGESACFFSAKGKIVAERIAHQALDRAAVVDWYEEFFFARKGKKKGRKYRDGVVRLLDERITSLREGRFADRLPATTPVFPALLTFDNIGENPVLYKWLRERCRVEGLLQQSDVAPLALIRIDRFEQLMSIAARGTSTVTILRRKSHPQYVKENFDRAMFSFSPPKEHLRLPDLEASYERIGDEVAKALFGAQHVSGSAS